MLAGLAEGPEDAKRKLEEALVSGAGYRKLCDMLEALGGDISYVENPEKLVAVKRKVSVCAPNDGYIASFDAKSLGVASCLLGAGRFRKEDKVDPAVGILMKKRCGESVRKGEPVAELYVNDESRLEEAVSLIESAVNYSEEKPGELPLVYTIIE